MSVTVLYGERVANAANARSEGEHLWLAPSDFAAATGWKLETEGLCRGDACVRVEPAWRSADGALDLAATYVGPSGTGYVVLDSSVDVDVVVTDSSGRPIVVHRYW